jgi:ADP-ribose pyrophosphatase
MTNLWVPHFKTSDVTILKEETVFSGYSKVKQVEVQIPLFQGGVNHRLQRELLCRPSAVAVLLFDPEKNQVVMIEQFRAGGLFERESPWMLEIVAGVVEPNDTPLASAYREVKEETGCEVLSLIPICSYFVSPGICTEKIIIYCARVKAPEATEFHGLVEEGEDIKIHMFSPEDAFLLLAQGKIVSSPTVIALQWLQLNLSSLQFPQ